LIAKNGTCYFDAARRSLYGNAYQVQQYWPRVKGLFARMECWTNAADATEVLWRSTSEGNVTSWYGLDGESRVADPADASRIFAWLIARSWDTKGSVISYVYKAENSEGVDLPHANERNRTDASRSTQRHIKNIFYGNLTPYFSVLTAAAATALLTDWCFELVFDYGEYAGAQGNRSAAELPADPLLGQPSHFRSAYLRALPPSAMFHHFPEEPNVELDCLARSTDFVHASSPPTDPSQPVCFYMLSATQIGYPGSSLVRVLRPPYGEMMVTGGASPTVESRRS
jgi:hypothetical protein